VSAFHRANVSLERPSSRCDAACRAEGLAPGRADTRLTQILTGVSASPTASRSFFGFLNRSCKMCRLPRPRHARVPYGFNPALRSERPSIVARASKPSAVRYKPGSRKPIQLVLLSDATSSDSDWEKSAEEPFADKPLALRDWLKGMDRMWQVSCGGDSSQSSCVGTQDYSGTGCWLPAPLMPTPSSVLVTV
jgi:hypothetical protein